MVPLEKDLLTIHFNITVPIRDIVKSQCIVVIQYILLNFFMSVFSIDQEAWSLWNFVTNFMVWSNFLAFPDSIRIPHYNRSNRGVYCWAADNLCEGILLNQYAASKLKVSFMLIWCKTIPYAQIFSKIWLKKLATDL